MKKTVLCIIFTLFLVLMCRSVFAMPANPAPFEVRQPDGSAIQIYIRGDERFHWYEDTDGYTVVCDNGRYAYGQLDKDNRYRESEKSHNFFDKLPQTRTIQNGTFL